MKWGSLYGPEYVNRLYRMVRRQTSGPIRFVCLTDDKTDLHPEIECHPCPEIAIPAPHNLRGWRKVNLFAKSEDLFGLEGDWLYIDLDVVITDSLDEFFTFKPELPFIVMQNWTQPGSGIGNTSIYRFRVGTDAYLLNDLLEQQTALIDKHINSQTYISRSIRSINFWPDEWCRLFKVHCIPAWPQRFWQEPVLPQGTKIVAFPGVPNPHEAAVGKWPSKSVLKRTYKYIRPTNWIQQHWN